MSSHDKLELTCLWIQEINDRQKHRIENSPHYPELPSNTLNSDRGDLDDSKVGDPARLKITSVLEVATM